MKRDGSGAKIGEENFLIGVRVHIIVILDGGEELGDLVSSRYAVVYFFGVPRIPLLRLPRNGFWC
jgi:hypothetical protein